MSSAAIRNANPPRSIIWAGFSLIGAGLAGIVAALLQLMPSTKDWLFEQTRKADNKSSNAKTRATTDEHIRHAIDTSGTSVVLLSVIALALLTYLAYSAWLGKSWSRWAIIGAFVFFTFTNITPGGGLGGLFLIGSQAPFAYKLFAFLGSLGVMAAVLLSNLRPSLVYLNAGRKPRASGGMFSPRPHPTRDAAAPPAKTATKPATVRTVSKSPSPAPDAAAEAKPRVRGKSRRASSEDKTP